MGRWKRVIAFTRKARNGSRQIREVQLGHTGLNPMTARGRSAVACISRPCSRAARRLPFHITVNTPHRPRRLPVEVAGLPMASSGSVPAATTIVRVRVRGFQGDAPAIERGKGRAFAKIKMAQSPKHFRFTTRVRPAYPVR